MRADIPKYSAPSEEVIPKEQLTTRTVAPNEWLSNIPRKGGGEVCAEKRKRSMRGMWTRTATKLHIRSERDLRLNFHRPLPTLSRGRPD